jgi:hypothetical protein
VLETNDPTRGRRSRSWSNSATPDATPRQHDEHKKSRTQTVSSVFSPQGPSLRSRLMPHNQGTDTRNEAKSRYSSRQSQARDSYQLKYCQSERSSMSGSYDVISDVVSGVNDEDLMSSGDDISEGNRNSRNEIIQAIASMDPAALNATVRDRLSTHLTINTSTNNSNNSNSNTTHHSNNSNIARRSPRASPRASPNASPRRPLTPPAAVLYLPRVLFSASFSAFLRSLAVVVTYSCWLCFCVLGREGCVFVC